ncbi:MAG: hypothetical protein U0136_06510 [Bdellovibrionota bacterium]
MKLQTALIHLAACAALFGNLACSGDATEDTEHDAGGSLGVEIVQASGEDFGPAFESARSLGVQFGQVFIPWDDIESSPGTFASETLIDASSFYASQSLPLLLTIAPIDTNNLRVPKDLQEKAFASSEMKDRFHALLDFVFSQIGDVELVAIAIGNEVDGYLGEDTARWSDYESFLRDAVSYIHSKRPHLRVGTVFGFDGLLSARSQRLLAVSDVAMTTYYPLGPDFSVRLLSDVPRDFDAMTAAAGGLKLIVTECGFPSAPVVGSSERLQSDFVSAVLDAWDFHGEQIPHLSYFSLTDYAPAFVSELGGYYGIRDPKFLGYLGSLGLRRSDGTVKPAFQTLRAARIQ